VALPQMIWLPPNFRFLDPGAPALLLMGQEWCLVHSLYRLSLVSLLPKVAAVQPLLMAPMAVPHTRLTLIFRLLNPAVPALLRMDQEWCLTHPLYTLLSPVVTAPLLRTAPMALPQLIWLPTHFRFLATGVPALLQPRQEWCLVHPRYMPSPVSVLPLVVTVPSHPGGA